MIYVFMICFRERKAITANAFIFLIYLTYHTKVDAEGEGQIFTTLLGTALWPRSNYSFDLTHYSMRKITLFDYIQGVPHHIRPSTGLNFDFRD